MEYQEEQIQESNLRKMLKKSIKIWRLKKKTNKKFGKLLDAGDADALRVFAYRFFFQWCF